MIDLDNEMKDVNASSISKMKANVRRDIDSLYKSGRYRLEDSEVEAVAKRAALKE